MPSAGVGFTGSASRLSSFPWDLECTGPTQGWGRWLSPVQKESTPQLVLLRRSQQSQTGSVCSGSALGVNRPQGAPGTLTLGMWSRHAALTAHQCSCGAVWSVQVRESKTCAELAAFVFSRPVLSQSKGQATGTLERKSEVTQGRPALPILFSFSRENTLSQVI